MRQEGPRTGTRFGPYELRSLLGKGGMGEVYEAYDTVKDRVVAVKLLSEELAKDPTYQVRFRRESQAAARLAEPHVIPIHDWGVIDGVLFIDMRLVHGNDLRTLLRAQGPLSPARAVGIIEQIASALDAAHADNLVHRDVKPANILVTDSDFAYLVDFGIAHTEGDSAVTLVGMAIGSYIYMAPERFDVGPVTGRADIYSLSCVLHECLTGATPFPAASMNVLIKSHMSDPPPRPSAQAGGIPPALDEVIGRGMAKDPADRFPTATAMARAARAALSAASPTGPTLVVRAPDAQRADTGVSRSIIPPEATGEISVIRPSAPTVVRATETQFTPLPAPDAPPSSPFAPPAPYTPAVGLPPIRPFPDAHLYPETQPRVPSAEPAQPYPAPYTPPQAYSDAPAYPSTARSPHPGAANYPPGGHYPDQGRPPSALDAHSPPAQFLPPGPRHGRATRTDYPPQGDYPARADYRAPDEGPGHQDYDAGYDPYYDAPYGPPRESRSIALPIMIAVLAIVVLAVGGVVGWQMFGSRGPQVTADRETDEPARPTPGPGGRTPAPSAAPSSSAAAKPTPVTLPAGATPCAQGQSASGAFSQSATGTPVTSCAFAEEVRKAYVALGAQNNARDTTRTVVAISPVTGRSYTMNCQAKGQLVTCSGGENAVVYVY